MSTTANITQESLSKLRILAEFRFELRRFLRFSECLGHAGQLLRR
jgi:hypothetical protein